MHSGVEIPDVVDLGFIQGLVEVPAPRDQVVLVPAADPQQTQLVFGLLDLGTSTLGCCRLGAEEKPPTQANLSMLFIPKLRP